MDVTLLLLVAGGCLLPLVALIWVALAYNRLVRQRNQARASWAQIEVQLTRRHDLVPSLVDTVKGYAAHERSALDAVVTARNGALHASVGPVPGRAAAENALSQTLGRLFALVEAYPDLRADRHFAALQRELAATEDKVAYARQFYNLAVQTLTNTIQSVPSNLVARAFGFRPPDYFEADDSVRGPAQVRFDAP